LNGRLGRILRRAAGRQPLGQRPATGRTRFVKPAANDIFAARTIPPFPPHRSIMQVRSQTRQFNGCGRDLAKWGHFATSRAIFS
jgi:hypothetical protein